MIMLPKASFLGPLRWWIPWKFQAGIAAIGRLRGYRALMEKYTPKEHWETYLHAKRAWYASTGLRQTNPFVYVWEVNGRISLRFLYCPKSALIAFNFSPCCLIFILSSTLKYYSGGPATHMEIMLVSNWRRFDGNWAGEPVGMMSTTEAELQ